MPDAPSPARLPRRFSLAQQGIRVRMGIAIGLVALVWSAILPLVVR